MKHTHSHIQVLRKQLINEAKDHCKEHAVAFGKCAYESSIMVVFKCRKLNEAMSNCYDKHYNEEAFQTYAKDRGFVTAKMLEK